MGAKIASTKLFFKDEEQIFVVLFHPVFFPSEALYHCVICIKLDDLCFQFCNLFFIESLFLFDLLEIHVRAVLEHLIVVIEEQHPNKERCARKDELIPERLGNPLDLEFDILDVLVHGSKDMEN